MKRWRQVLTKNKDKSLEIREVCKPKLKTYPKLSAASQKVGIVQSFSCSVQLYWLYKTFWKTSYFSSKIDFLTTFQLPHCHLLAHSTWQNFLCFTDKSTNKQVGHKRRPSQITLRKVQQRVYWCKTEKIYRENSGKSKDCSMPYLWERILTATCEHVSVTSL